MRWPHLGIGRRLDVASRRRLLAAIEGTAIGLALGLIDIHSTNADSFHPTVAYLVAGFVLGLRHGGRSWPAWGPLGWCFYLMHRVAIAGGYRPPYVEEDAEKALLSLVFLWPAGLGLAVGALVRLPIVGLLRTLRSPSDAADPDRSEAGSDGTGPAGGPRRAPSPAPVGAFVERRARRPLTVGGWMVLIALIGIQLSALRALLINDPSLGLGTVYAPGYSESRFRSLRVGMSCAEVESIMGRPLRVVSRDRTSGAYGTEMWYYSDQPNDLANFHRRWVYFEGSKVTAVINDFWID